MKKILFTCMGGMSSSLIAAKFKDYLITKGFSVLFLTVASENDIQQIKDSEADYTIVYMPIMALNNQNRIKYGPIFDVVLIAPQSGHMLSKIKADAIGIGHDPNVIRRIPGKVYGRIDVEQIYEMTII